ncbi:hypothetical protein IAR55_006684 [Kwoniella newhampshirensis]|uniref:cellulase n=1 Tax=Kwoniella newhampshirensis TaxID=1651941 RepID=A0AAW0YEV7_9TREE
MLIKQLVTVFALLATGSAAPVHQITKRALPRLGGVNLAGCDFGINPDGSSGTSYCPGTEQIAHFINDGANVFRLPVGWQYLVDSNSASTSLDATFFATYDNLVQSVTSQGAYAMIDIHNYARWNGQIVGQGGPSNADFARLWSLLATHYANNDRVIFGIMNEPHDLDINEWATTVQAAVNAIRAAGATTQTIALPGTGYTGVDTWSSGGSDALLQVTDPADSSNSLLIIDAHKYLDGNGSGTDSECSNNGVSSATSFANWLRTNGRKAIISETGGGNTASCRTDLNQFLSYLSSHTDVFVGFTIWSAGSFATDYTLSITPNGNTDNQLFVDAIEPYLPGASGAAPAASSPILSAAASSVSASLATSSSAASPNSAADATSIVPSSYASSTAAVATSQAINHTSSTVPTASASEPTETSSDDGSCTEYTEEPSSASATTIASLTASSADPFPTETVASSSAASSASEAVSPSTSAIASSVIPTSDVVSSSAAASAPTSVSASISTSALSPVSSALATTDSVSSTASATSSSPSGVVGSGGLQTFTGALGGIPVPAVSASGNKWTTGNQTYNFLIDALNASCYSQMNSCQLAANRGGNHGDLTVSACEGQTDIQQIQACLAAASSASSASASSTASAKMHIAASQSGV